MSDMASSSANALSVQQLFASLTGQGASGTSSTDPDLFGQNLPTDLGDTAKSASSSKSGPSTGASLADQARSKRDAALAQSRLDLLGLQEQSGKGRGAHGAHHHGKPTGATDTAKSTAAAANPQDPPGADQTGITGAAANDEKASGLSTLLLAQLAA